MKLKRKLYPNSNDKEVISMSINDLVEFGIYSSLCDGNVDNLKKLINTMLETNGLKTPASHQKTTKKSKQQKIEENFSNELDSTGLNEGDSPF